MLAPAPWKKLETLFGPYTFDLMALDSNAQIGCSGSPLPHFTPFPAPGSRGVNVFAQDVPSQENAHVFPPFVLLGPLLRFLGKASGLIFKQGYLIVSSWTVKLFAISCYFHLRTAFFPHVLYLGICMLLGLPTRSRLSFL